MVNMLINKHIKILTWLTSLGWEDLLEEEMAPHSGLLPGECHGQRSLAGYSPRGLKESEMNN